MHSGMAIDLVLRELTLADEQAFRDAVREFEASDPEWDFAFWDDDDSYPDFVARLDRERRGEGLRPGFVASTFLVGVVGPKIVGRLSLRHALSPALIEVGGHIGYGVVPSERRRGHATEMLRRSFGPARELGLERVLVTCDDDNVGSIKTIERCGGVLEDVRVVPGSTVPKRRYWITLR